MKASRDPEQHELEHLLNACSLRGKQILEIGCGHGQLINQYSDLPQKIFGIDLNHSELQDAFYANHVPNVFLVQSKAEHISFPTSSFDTVLFASSL